MTGQGKETCGACAFLAKASNPKSKAYWCDNPVLEQDDDHDGQLSFKPPNLHFGCTLFKSAKQA